MADPHAPHAGTEYATYLLVDDLLTLQRPLTPGAHDELLFIVVHQAYELWFKLLLHELRRARDLLLDGHAVATLATLERVLRVDALLLEQLEVLESMTPDGFLAFRDPLAPASGFQSRQFRALEALCGSRSGEDADGAPTLWVAFCQAGRAAGLDLPDGPHEEAARRRIAGLASLYRADPADAALGPLRLVAERLLDHDERTARWRHHHALMAAREIGTRTGTGGSLGVAYLQGTLDQRFFPDLWAVRGAL